MLSRAKDFRVHFVSGLVDVDKNSVTIIMIFSCGSYTMSYTRAP